MYLPPTLITRGTALRRRVHLSTEQPYRAGPKSAEAGPKRAPEDPLGMVPERLSLRGSSGARFASFRSSLIGLFD